MYDNVHASAFKRLRRPLAHVFLVSAMGGDNMYNAEDACFWVLLVLMLMLMVAMMMVVVVILRVLVGMDVIMVLMVMVMIMVMVMVVMFVIVTVIMLMLMLMFMLMIPLPDILKPEPGHGIARHTSQAANLLQRTP